MTTHWISDLSSDPLSRTIPPLSDPSDHNDNALFQRF
jgi:hypothetical protein